MKIFAINAVPYGSTCNIMLGVARVAEQKGHTVVTASGYSTHPCKDLPREHYPIGGFVNKALHMVMARLTGLHGCFSYFATLRLVRRLKRYGADLIHLHNLHGWYVNLPMLFRYIKKHNIPVVWTLHDCWAFTGQCPHFTMVKCDRWRTGCHHCPQYRQYPQSYVDCTRTMWRRKRKWFTGVENMTVVTPSRWLSGLVKESFLKEYPVKVIHNGIDLDIFKPTESDFREVHGLQNKKLVLGVSFGWSRRKGLDVFLTLAERLDDRYRIVLVGTDREVDKLLPDNILSIHRTQDQKELARIYTAADVFVNPTREENYPTVNLEAVACGTPVITFNTGGSPEMLDERWDAVVARDDVDGMERAIRSLCEGDAGKAPRELSPDFDAGARFREYMSLYDTMMGG